MTDSTKAGKTVGPRVLVGDERTPPLFFVAQVVPFKSSDTPEGTTTKDEESAIIVDDRSPNVQIPRTDDGMEWAYENDVSVANSVDRLDNIMNTGFDVFISEEFKDVKKAQKAKALIEERMKVVPTKMSSVIKMRSIFGFSILKKVIKDKDIIGLVELDSKECKPIRNPFTGDLGGETGKGVDPDNEQKEIALVQVGNTVEYDKDGEPQYNQKNFYFGRTDIIPFTNNDRGKFKGVSPVRRVIRLVESKKTIENLIEMIVRRFGPQIWLKVGNEKINFQNAEIPSEFLRDSDGNTIDKVTARNSWKAAIFSNIAENVEKWVNGETLFQIAEWGLEVEVINPSSNLADYVRYVMLYADFIKIGILGLDVPGRVDVTSSVMLERLTRDIKDKLTRDRNNIEWILTEEYVKPILKANEFNQEMIFIKHKPMDMFDLEKEVGIERQKSETVFNYARSGLTEIPEHIVKKWGLEKVKKLSFGRVKENVKKDSEGNPAVKETKDQSTNKNR